jgi:hypothetical protein
VSARVPVLLSGVVGITVLAGCGGSGSNAPAVARVGTGRSSTSASSASAAPGNLAQDTGDNPHGGPAGIFNACLRTHGVPNMPDPSPGKGSPLPPGVDPNSPRFQKAVRECVKLVPADAPPDMVAHPVGPLLAFAKCMRAHGVAGYPDPDGQGHFHQSALSRVDASASVFQTALKTCRPLADNEPLARVP